MLKSFVKALGFMAAWVLSGAACAVSMGNINVTTALGEPLKAEIALSDLGKGGKNKISVHLASPDAYKEAGLDYPAGLPKLKFQIETRADDEAYLSVTSSQPINDPFVNLMVELNWPSGKLLRSYTFLLDPPGFKPEQPKAEQVQPLAPSTASMPAAPQAEPAPAPQEPMQAAAPAEEKAPSAPAPVAAPAAKPAAKPATTSSVASGPIEVKHGDTLNKIARDAKPADVSLERMLVAMYRANEDQFDGHNMNRIRTGKILRLPEAGELNKVVQAEAVEEIRAQVADWHAYRQKLAAASVSVEEQKPRQEASGKIATTVADKTPPVKESAKEVVRLSKGEAPGDKAAVGGKSMQDKLHSLQEEAIARDKMLKESYERIAILEKNIKEMQHLLELKGQPASPKPGEAKPAETKPVTVAAPPAVSVSAIAPAAPAAKPARRKAAPPPPPPSLLDDILAEPLYLAGGGVALLGLLGGGFMLLKRRGKGGKPAAGKGLDAADTGSHIAAPVAPSPDTGDFTLSGAAQAAPESASDVDPIKEADLFLSFGRDAQAEDILKDALAENPGNQEIRIKLLSIYSARKDAKTFSAIAHQVQDSGDQAAWAQVAEMGRKLDPGNPMYGAADEQAVTGGMAEDESTLTQSSAHLDFDLGAGAQAEAASAAELDVPVDKTEDTFSGLDLDLGTGAQEEAAPHAAGAEVAAAPDEPAADMASTMDFDLGLDMAGSTAAGTEAGSAAETPPEAEGKATGGDGALDFDITMETPGLTEQEAGEAAKQPAAASGMDGLDFDITGAHSVELPEAAAGEAEQAGDSGAITLDFPAPEAPAEESAAVPAAVGLADISLDLEPPAPAAAPAAPKEDVKDARWHDVATKLDLARAYQEMGDAAGAKEILDEVLKEGDAQQRATAQAMIQQLS